MLDFDKPATSDFGRMYDYNEGALVVDRSAWFRHFVESVCAGETIGVLIEYHDSPAVLWSRGVGKSENAVDTALVWMYHLVNSAEDFLAKSVSFFCLSQEVHDPRAHEPHAVIRY